MNTHAFRAGRLPGRGARLGGDDQAAPARAPSPRGRASSIAERAGSGRFRGGAAGELRATARRFAGPRADRLPGRGVRAPARRLRPDASPDAERAAVPGETRLAEAVARYLFKLMAYKDEYEVARLHLKNDLAAQLAEEYPGWRARSGTRPATRRCCGPWDGGQICSVVVRLRLPGARRDAGSARGRSRSLRSRGGAGWSGLLGEELRLVERTLAGNPRHLQAIKSRSSAAARSDPRLRGHQAGQRRSSARRVRALGA